MLRLQTLLAIIILNPQLSLSQNITVSGFIKEPGSKENIPYVNVTVNIIHGGTSSNAFGFYSIQIPSGRETEIRFSAVGYQTLERKILSDENIELDVELIPETQELKEIVIEGEDENLLNGNRPLQLPVRTIKEVPALLGEKDLIKVIQLLPGIQRAAEGSTALYVRGGGPDQNLILLDDAQVYNANHLFGFFSVFNGDAVKRFDFWKSGFPARYGGRVSSIIDVRMKDGNKQKIQGEGGIGLLSGRLTVEGPIKKEKSSFLISGRRMYLDLLTMPFMANDSKFGYRFYDLNAKASFDHNSRNKFFISGYFGSDKLLTLEETKRSSSAINARTDLGWGNATATFRWNHIFNKRLFANTTLLYSNFRFFLKDSYKRTGSQANSNYTEYRSQVTDYSIKTDLDYFLSNGHNIKTGILFTYHQYQPRTFVFNSSNEDNQRDIERYENVELAGYLEDTWDITEKISINTGVRVNGLAAAERNFVFVEPRVSASLVLLRSYRLTGAYTRSNQFVHLLSNTGVGLSTDLWVPVTSKAPPQQGDQFSIGLSRKFAKQDFTVTLESYRKYLRNIIAYRQGASFLVIAEGLDNFNWEDNITIGNGLSYGTELLLQKDKGNLTGWLGYTLSWTVHEFDELNNGNRFYPKYDSRHSVSVAGIYKISPKIKLSATWVYNTGNALTIPQAYYYGNVSTGTNLRTILNQNVFSNVLQTEQINRIPYYGSRNSFRAESYHRLDIAAQFYKKKKKYERYWEFGLFNAYNRKNPFYYYLQATNDPSGLGQRISLKKKSLFPVLPSISYNVKF